MIKMDEEQYMEEEVIYDNIGIKINDNYIMFKNEEGYIKKSIELLYNRVKPHTVMEFGFGLGYTATKFQELGIERHIIIESHPEIFQKALEWSKNYPNKDIMIINEFWQDFRTTELIDLIYDDTFDMVYKQNDFERAKKFNSRYWACFCDIVPKDIDRNKMWSDGFWFEFDNIEKFQPLKKWR